MSEGAPLTVAEIRAEVKNALEHAHEQAEFWLEERDALQEMAVPLGVPWPGDEDEPAHAEGQVGGSDSAASDEDEKPEPPPSSLRRHDVRTLPPEEQERAVRLGRLSGKQREELLLAYLHQHHGDDEVSGPDLRDGIGMASSDFGNAIRGLRNRGLIEDRGHVRRPDGGKTQAKLWKLSARNGRHDPGDLSDLGEERTKDDGGTIQGRVLGQLQFTPASGERLEQTLKLSPDEVGAAITTLMQEGEVEQIDGGLYRAVG